MRQLIVSADDLGLTKSINLGIAKARREGIVSFINIMPTGDAFDDAISLVKEMGVREVGAHLALTETAPCAEISAVPSLVSKDGGFYKNHNEFFIKFLLRSIKHDQVYSELKKQVEKIRDAGMNITCLSSHEHIHMIPEMLEIFIRLAKEYNIRCMRYPHKDTLLRKFDISSHYKSAILAYFDKKMESVLNRAGIRYAEHFMGFLDSGRLNEETLIEMVNSMKEGSTELVTHPGFLGPEVMDRYRFHMNCETELHALTSPRVKRLIEEKNIKLTTYQGL